MAPKSQTGLKRKQTGDLLSNLKEDSIDRIVQELRREPANIFAAEKIIMGNSLLEADKDDSGVEKPFPDSYNVMKVIPRDFKQAAVCIIKPTTFDDDMAEKVCAKQKDGFNKVFYFLHGVGPATTNPKVARHKAVWREMCIRRYRQLCVSFGRPLVDEVKISVDGTIDLSTIAWWTLEANPAGDQYVRIKHRSGAVATFEEPLKVQHWHLDSAHLMEEAFVYKALPSGKKAMIQQALEFFDDGALKSYRAIELPTLAKKVHLDKVAPGQIQPAASTLASSASFAGTPNKKLRYKQPPPEQESETGAEAAIQEPPR